jgi:hypothetical protein
MKPKFLSLIVLLLSSVSVMAQTPWIDGQDTSVPDRGRGVSDWNAHYQYGATTGDVSLIPGYVRDRVLDLKGRLSRPTYSRLYADLTYLIASYGLRSAGWVNGGDAAAPPDDGNRGLLNWDAHRDYVLKSVGYDVAGKLIFERLNSLQGTLGKEEFARCYADCSILILNFSRMK